MKTLKDIIRTVEAHTIQNQFGVIAELFKTQKEAKRKLKEYKNTDYFYYFTNVTTVETTDKTLW